MLDNKPQFVPEFVCNSPEIVRDSANHQTALSPTYERESKGIPFSIHGATTQSGFRGTDARTKPSHGLGLNHPTDYHPAEISQLSQDRNTTSVHPGPG